MKKLLLLFILLSLSWSAWSSVQESQLKIGDKAPDFTLTDPQGKSISLSQFRGKVVLVDFWASWCVPCREANPDLVKMYNLYNSQGFEILSISLDNNKDQWIKAIQQDKLPWNNHGSELKGWDSKVAALYGVEGIPAAYLIDENGMILDMDFDVYDLEQKLNYYYNEKVNVYPKTTASKIYFTAEAKYQVEDKTGKVLLKGKATEVDLTGMAYGEYIVRLDGHAEKITKANLGGSDITFYPQRVDDQITLSAEAEFEVYNARGGLVRKGKGTNISATGLKAGSYYLSINGTVHSFYKK